MSIPVDIIPTCLGLHERGDRDCDGDPAALTDVDEQPCAWRDRCYGFKLHIARNREKPSHHLKIVGLNAREQELTGFTETAEPISGDASEFRRICRHAFETLPTKRQMAAFLLPELSKDEGAPSVVRGVRAKERRRARAARIALAKDRREHFVWLHDCFFDSLSESLHPRKIYRRTAALIFPGHLRYMMGRTDNNGELRYRQRNGKDLVIVGHSFMVKDRVLRVRLNASLRDVSAALNRSDYDQTSPEPTHRVRLRTQFSRAGLSELKIISACISTLVSKGKIVIPELV